MSTSEKGPGKPPGGAEPPGGPPGEGGGPAGSGRGARGLDRPGSPRWQLPPPVYEQLKQLAEKHLRSERRGHTLRPTDLAHECYVRLGDQAASLASRGVFLAAASKVIRNILVDHARRRNADRRGGGVTPESYEQDEAPVVDGLPLLDLVAVDVALDKLARLHQRQAQVVELHVFGGLHLKTDIAALLQVSPATVVSDWVVAKAFLERELDGGR